jgi:cytochrome P450
VVEFDPFSEAYYRGAYEDFRELRDRAPVYRNDRLDFYALSRFDDVHHAFRDFTTFISGQGVLLDQLLTPGFVAGENLPGFLISYDPPSHTRLRNLALPGLTRRAVDMLADDIRGTARRGLDALIGRSSFDMVTDFANMFPVEVLYALMGVPAHDRRTLFDYAMDWVEAGDPADPEYAHRHGMAMANLSNYVLELTTRKRGDPGEDLISRMLRTEFVDDAGVPQRITDVEMGGYLVLLFAAGVETTTKMLAAATVAFHRHPDQWRKVVDRPDLMADAVEELGRYDPPVHYIGRKTAREVELHGVRIPAQSNVLLLIGAANRDERVYEDPDVFDVERVMPRRPLTFGFGHHLCLGASLARLETRIALEEFALRWPEYTVAEAGLVRGKAISACGYAQVPVKVCPRPTTSTIRRSA